MINKMSIENFTIMLERHIGTELASFACYHDELFVYTITTEDLSVDVEITFMIKDNSFLCDFMGVDDILNQMDKDKYFHITLIDVDRSIDDININELL